MDGLGLIRQLNAILQNLTWHLGTREMIQVYNQNGDGYVCLHEFIEAHGILQIALRMNPSEEEDPPVLRGDLHNLFVHVIGDSDPRIEDLRRSGTIWAPKGPKGPILATQKALLPPETKGDARIYLDSPFESV